MLMSLNDDIIILIIHKLSYQNIIKLLQLNKKYNFLCKENAENITQIIYNNEPCFFNAKSIKILADYNVDSSKSIRHLSYTDLNKFKKYENLTFENVIISQVHIINNHYKKNIKYLKLCNTNLIIYFNPINYMSLTSLTLINNNSIFINNNYDNNTIINNLLLLTKLKSLYIENSFSNTPCDLYKLTSLTNITSLGLCNIRTEICNNYNFLKNMTALKKLYLNKYNSDLKYSAPLHLNELYVQSIYSKIEQFNYSHTFLNIKIIDISNTFYLYSYTILSIIQKYYRTLEKLYMNNCNIGDLVIHNILSFIREKIPLLKLDFYLKYNRFNFNSLIKLYNSSKNINIYISKHDMCLNNIDKNMNYNRIFIL
jgi:hypothetical protein